jgi:hypothetical protein
MSVVVVVVSGRDVLISQSGIFLADRDWIADIRAQQRIDKLPANTAVGTRPVANTAADKALATQQFLTRAENLTRTLRASRNIEQYDKVTLKQVEWKDAVVQHGEALDDRYTTRFLYPANPPGFIKGTFPDPGHPGETAQQAAAREFFEETSTQLPLASFRVIQPTIFMVTIPPDQKQQIIETWRALPTGELSDLRWEPIRDVLTDIGILNLESRPAAPFLPPVGGRKKTIRRKKSKQPTKKGTLKRGVRR